MTCCRIKKGIDLGLAERFNDSIIDITASATLERKITMQEQNLFVLENNTFSKRSIFDNLKSELFEKIVHVPCWFEYDEKTQLDLITKFLVSKKIKTPDIFAKILQHSTLGFGVFDDYLAQNDVSAIYYTEGEPLIYTRNNINITDNIVFSQNKVELVIKNIVNMSRMSDDICVFNFRFGNYWVELRKFPQAKVNLSVIKIDSNFLDNQFKLSALSTLSLDY